MAASKEAKLIMSLVDHVTGPGKAIARSLGMVDRSVRSFGSASMAPARAVGQMGRSFRRSATDSAMFSAAIGLGARKAAENVYQFEKTGNAAEAIGMMTEQQREAIEAYGRVLNVDFPFKNKDIMEAAVELLRAGYTFEQTMGSLKDALNTSLAGDIGLGRTADILTNVAQAMRLPIATQQETAETTKRVSDVLAYAANRSNTDIEKMGITFKYVAPLAAATGMSLEEMAAATMLLANNGIKGSDAGTGLRFALGRILKPSKEASKALDLLNIDLGNFIEGARRINATDVVSQLSLDGIDASGMEKQIQKILDDPADKLSPAKLTGKLTAFISEALGAEDLIDKDVLSNNLSETLTVLGTQIDFKGLLRSLRDNPQSQALIPTIFGVRHGPKMMALMAGDMDGTLAALEEKYRGAADRMSKIRMKGVVGDVARFVAVMDNLTMTLSDSGVLESARKALQGMAVAIAKIGETNPKVLELGTYALLALATIAPLGFAMSGAAAAAALLLNPITGIVAALGTLVAFNFSAIKDFFSVFSSSFATGIDAEIVGRFRDLSSAIGDFFTQPWVTGQNADAFGQFARNMGIGLADGVNQAYEAIGRLKEVGAAIRGFAQGAWADMGPKVAVGMESLKAALSGFVMPKVDGLASLATSVVDFAERALPYLKPAAFAGLDLIAASFNTLASGAGAVSRVLGGVTSAFVEFNRGLYNAIDPAALEAISNGLTSVFGGISTGLSPLRAMFDSIDIDLGSFAANAGAKVGEGVSAIINAFAGIAGWAPDFAGIIGAVRSLASAIAAAVDTIVGAVGRAIDALARLANAKAGAGTVAQGMFGAPGVSSGKPSTPPSGGSLIGSAVKPAGRRKSGGPMRAAMPYQLHENELVTLGRNSYVTPASRIVEDGGGRSAPMRGGTTVYQTFNNTFPITGAQDPEAAARKIGGLLQGQLNRSRQISMEDRAII